MYKMYYGIKCSFGEFKLSRYMSIKNKHMYNAADGIYILYNLINFSQEKTRSIKTMSSSQEKQLTCHAVHTVKFSLQYFF